MPATLDTQLIPLRALNQVTYCPRLYFLQYVDAVMPTNEHVEGGLFDHRRVTEPGLKDRARKENGTLHTRSVHLSSERLGLTGVLDVLEEKDGESYPVETKHGSAPRDADGQLTFYDNDAVQLCGQALLLEEELEHPIERGFIFYAGSRERIEVKIDARLRQQTLAAMEQIRQLAQAESLPPPLPCELRHRCHGCSLAPVCLPEETLFEITRPASAPSRPEFTAPGAALTRVIPQADDGAVLYVQEPGAHVGKRSEHLIIKKDGKELGKAPLHAVRQVVVFGNVQLSTQALETLAANEIPVAYLSGHGKFLAMLLPAPAKNVSLREAQFRRFADPAECLSLAKAIVRAKLTNQRAFLMRCLRSAGSSEEPPSTNDVAVSPCPPVSLSAFAARDLAELLARLDAVTSLESLLGLEGQGAALYFGEFHRFLKAQPPGRGFDFKHRNRRPPRDPVNALLSFAYALLVKDCFSAVCTVGFDPYKGFYHTGRHGRPSLALDLMEEFRTVIADSVVITLINNRSVTPDDFLTWRDACQLTESGRKKFFAAYEQRKATVVTHPVYGYKMSYSRMLEVQARMLAAYLRGDVPAYTGFIVR